MADLVPVEDLADEIIFLINEYVLESDDNLTANARALKQFLIGKLRVLDKEIFEYNRTTKPPWGAIEDVMRND